MNTPTNWESHIFQEYNIEMIKSVESLQGIFEENQVLFTTRCSKTKIKESGVFYPHQLYTNRENIQFYSVMNKNNFNFGIISDLHGLVFSDEMISPYDKHPSELSPEDYINLGGTINDKMSSRNYDTLIFYNSSPKLSTPYFKILKQSKLKVYYITKLELMDLKKQDLGIVVGDIRPLREIVEQIASKLEYKKPYTLNYLTAEIAKFNLDLRDSYISMALRKCVVNDSRRVLMGNMTDAFYTDGKYYYRYHPEMKDIPVYNFNKEQAKENRKKAKELRNNKKSLF